ncbi:MAG: hypothetical protein HYX79_06765 [Chloroflexi bacterium]|nr:hypothetical protein [Chloroflexota bacterium]
MTSVTSDTNGTSASSIKFYPYGLTRSGSVPTDKKFTGQRLDSTGLYYYNARYYDAEIGRFISGDSIVPYFTGLGLPSAPLTVNMVHMDWGA